MAVLLQLINRCTYGKGRASEVAFTPSLKPNLSKSEAEEQTNMPCDHPQPTEPKSIETRSFQVIWIFTYMPTNWLKREQKTILACKSYQNSEVRAGPVGQWASSAPMLWKKRPVKLLPLMAGMLEGASQPIKPNPITFKSVLSQSLSKLQKNQAQTIISLILNHPHKIRRITTSSYHVNLPPETCANFSGLAASTGVLMKPEKYIHGSCMYV